MDQQKNKLAAIVGLFILLIGIGYGYWNFFYSPLSKELTKKRGVVKEMESKVQQAEARAKQIDQLKKELSLLDLEVARLEKQLPKTKEIPALLRTMTTQASSNGISLVTITPGAAITKGIYDEVPYSISATGSLHSLAKFLTSLGQLQRLLSARNVTANASAGKGDSSKTISTNFTLVAFKYHE